MFGRENLYKRPDPGSSDDCEVLRALGDHATNVAEWVEFSLTGKHRSGKEVNDVFAVLQ